MLFADIQPLTFAFLAALAVTTAVLLLRAQRYFARQPRSETGLDSARSHLVSAETSQHSEIPESMARWEVQMHETARELSARLDSKMSALQALIADADRAAARLEAAPGRGPQPSPAASPEAASAVEALPTPPATQAEALRPQRELHPAEKTTEKPPAAPDRSAQEQRREEIYTLADYGFSAADIASRVGSPIGEVQLILGLREKKT